MVTSIFVLCDESPVASTEDFASLVHFAHDDHLDGSLDSQVRHQREWVHKDIVVCLQHEFGVAPIQRHPSQRRDRLERQITVVVDERLDWTILCVARSFISIFATYGFDSFDFPRKKTSRTVLGAKYLGLPQLTRMPLEVFQGRVNVRQEKDVSSDTITAQVLAVQDVNG